MHKKVCHPIFSERDSDLQQRRWRKDKDGYARMTVNRPLALFCIRDTVTVYAHRLVASRMIGRKLLPGECVDHINFDILDNRRCNLRVVTNQKNAQHRRPRNRVGVRGITKTRSGKWQAIVRHNDKSHYAGTYATVEEAGRAAAFKRQELGFPS